MRDRLTGMEPLLALIANAKDGTITTLRVADGSLAAVATTAVAPGLPLAVDRDRRLVFAGTSDPTGVSVLRLADDGSLEPLASYPAHGAPVYLTLSSDGGLLFSASYHDHVGEVWQVSAEGALTPVGEPIRRQNMHSVILSPDDRFAYFVSLREDLVAQFAVGPDGALTPLDPPTAPAPEGSGPRHLILDAAATSLYVNTEYSGEALRYRRDPETGTLDVAERVTNIPTDRGLSHSRFGADPRAEDLIWGSDLRLSTDGRRLYSAERTRGTITAVEVGADGALGRATAHSDVAAQPRHFVVLPDDTVLVASEIDRVVALYRPDADGALTQIARHPVGLGANWIEIL